MLFKNLFNNNEKIIVYTTILYINFTAKSNANKNRYLWFPGITTYLHFLLFRVNGVFSFASVF